MPTFLLNDAEIDHFRTEGFVVTTGVFDAADLGEIDATIESLAREATTGKDMSGVLELEPDAVDGRRVPRRIYDPFGQHECFRRLATDPRLLDRVESLIGPDINLQHSKLNMKPARVGSKVEWHQDLAYFPHTNDDLVTVLIYLDDATLENGCLQVLPRHHFHFFDHSAPDGSFAGMITEEIADGRFGKPQPLAAGAGSVIFMHCLTPHCSLPNEMDRSRRTLIFEYRAADSFPIYYGEMTTTAEARFRPLRAKIARFARFGGPRPLIPKVGKYDSLYELQARQKQNGVREKELLAASATDR